MSFMVKDTQFFLVHPVLMDWLTFTDTNEGMILSANFSNEEIKYQALVMFGDTPKMKKQKQKWLESSWDTLG